MSTTVYGLANCDSTKAAIKYYKQQQVLFVLHDLRSDGITKEKLMGWMKDIPLDKLLNKKSTTWRTLSAAEQAKADTTAGAVQLMIDNSNLIKRPVIELDGKLQSVGLIPGDAKK